MAMRRTQFTISSGMGAACAWLLGEVGCSRHWKAKRQKEEQGTGEAVSRRSERGIEGCCRSMAHLP